MKKTIWCLTLVGVAFALIIIASAIFVPKKTFAESEYNELSITDMGEPIFAGAGDSAMDEDTLYYYSGNTVGFNFDVSSSVLTADYMFNNMRFPNWFSVTLKADRVDRYNAPDLKGYVVTFSPSGKIGVLKGGEEIVSGQASPIYDSQLYRISIGAVNEVGSVRLFVSINGQEVLNAVDSNNPYLDGEWVNICGEGTIEAQIKSINYINLPEYSTYTLNTVQCYPIVTGTSSMPVADDNNNIETFDASNCIGFNLHLQNFSFEAKFNFKSFEAGRFGVAWRMSSFNRVHGSDGYSAWFYQYGMVELYKGSELVASSVCVPMIVGRDYIIEVGAVDFSESKTKVFVLVDEKEYIGYIDETPIQNPGYLNMNGEGNVSFTATSVSTKLIVGGVDIKETQDNVDLSVKFINNYSIDSLVYAEFSDEILSALLLNRLSVKDINDSYINTNGDRAVNVTYINSTLKITILKQMISETGTIYDFGELKSFEIKKSIKGEKVASPSGLYLNQSYIVLF